MEESQLIAFLGDSLTESGHWQEQFPEHTVVNFGVAGDTTNSIIERLQQVIDATPGTVVLLAGTNDLAWRFSAEHIVRNIETILVLLRKALPKAYLVVQSVLPREAEYAEVIKNINRHLWQFSPTVRAQFVDLWPVLANGSGALNEGCTEDGLHLNTSGYDAWAGELARTLEVFWAHTPTSTSIPIPPEHLRRRDRR